MRNIAQTFVIVGNHDLIHNRVFLEPEHWLNALKEWENVVIVDNVKKININENLLKFWNSVNKNIYGMTKVKEKMLECLNTYLHSKGAVGRIITLIGDPGTGKTSMAMALAEAMNMPFQQISMSDITDPSVLIGHSSTYISSHPGILVETLIKFGRLDGLVLLDEIDKVKTNPVDGHSLSTVLLKILDKVQNKKFNDSYMPEIDIDLSKIIFVATANKEEDIPSALLDRLYKIYVDGYSDADKVRIGKDYIMPKLLRDINLHPTDVEIDNSVMEHIVTNGISKSNGIRELEHTLQELNDRLLLLSKLDDQNINLSYRTTKTKVKFPIRVTKQMIDNLVIRNHL